MTPVLFNLYTIVWESVLSKQWVVSTVRSVGWQSCQIYGRQPPRIRQCSLYTKRISAVARAQTHDINKNFREHVRSFTHSRIPNVWKVVVLLWRVGSWKHCPVVNSSWASESWSWHSSNERNIAHRVSAWHSRIWRWLLSLDGWGLVAFQLFRRCWWHWAHR